MRRYDRGGSVQLAPVVHDRSGGRRGEHLHHGRRAHDHGRRQRSVREEPLAREGGSGEGGGIVDWWNRKDYDCQKVICDCIMYQYEAETSVQVEEGKGTVAHAWNCTACGNCGL